MNKSGKKEVDPCSRPLTIGWLYTPKQIRHTVLHTFVKERLRGVIK